MPINPIRDRKGRARFQFEFSRRIDGKRVRARKLLPASWSRAQADAFDRQECGRLYAIARGTERARHTIDQAVARYLDERAGELKHGRGLAQELALMLEFYEGRPLETLPAVCAAYLKAQRAELAPATIKNRLRYLVAACRWGWKHHRMCEHDPGAGVVFPAVSNARQVYIDRAQMLALARACPNRPARAMIRIAWYSGMRIGEIEAAAVDLAAGVFRLDDTKNGAPRIVPMHPRIRVCAAMPRPSRYVFGYWFRRARQAVGLPHLHPHDLRHSAASELIRVGVDLYTVGFVLGHKSAASTKRYAHHATQQAADAIGKMGKREGPKAA